MGVGGGAQSDWPVSGALKDVRADDLLGQVIAALVAKTGIDPGQIDDVIAGCANQAANNRNVAWRMALLLAGLPQSVPGATVNRLCGSGLEAVLQTSRNDRGRTGRPVHRWRRRVDDSGATRPGQSQTPRSSVAIRRCSIPRWAGAFPIRPWPGCSRFEAMGETAENLVERYQISRSDQDAFALRSHQRAVAARRRPVGLAARLCR